MAIIFSVLFLTTAPLSQFENGVSWIVGFSFYLLGHLSSPGSDGLGVGILYSFFGPLLTFISWLILLWLLRLLYYGLTRQKVPSISFTPKDYTKTQLAVMGTCVLVVIVTNIIFFSYVIHH